MKKKKRDGKEHRNSELTVERERERDEGSARATRKQAAAVVKTGRGTFATESVCVCVSVRSRYWRGVCWVRRLSDKISARTVYVYSGRDVERHVLAVTLGQKYTL